MFFLGLYSFNKNNFSLIFQGIIDTKKVGQAANNQIDLQTSYFKNQICFKSSMRVRISFVILAMFAPMAVIKTAVQ